MKNFFNMDNSVFTALGKLCDMLFLSVVFVLVCIPVITIGPANTALYYATVKVIRRERGYLFREFFKSFKLNFKRGAIIGVGLTIMFVVLAFDLLAAWATSNNEGSKNSIFFGIFLAFTLLLLCFSLYVFPLLSRFDMTVMQIIKASMFMSMRHLPFTILMALILIASIVGVFYMPMLIFIVPSSVAFVNSFFMERVLKKYMPKAEDTEENTSKDEWYNE